MAEVAPGQQLEDYKSLIQRMLIRKHPNKHSPRRHVNPNGADAAQIDVKTNRSLKPPQSSGSLHSHLYGSRNKDYRNITQNAREFREEGFPLLNLRRRSVACMTVSPRQVFIDTAPVQPEAEAEHQLLDRQPSRAPSQQVPQVPDGFNVPGPEPFESEKKENI